MGIRGISAFPGELDMSGETVIGNIYATTDIWGVKYVMYISGDSDETDEADQMVELLAMDIPDDMDITYISDESDTVVILHQI